MTQRWENFLKLFVFGLFVGVIGFVHLGKMNSIDQANLPFANGVRTIATVVHIQELHGRRENTTGGVSVEFIDETGERQRAYVQKAIAPHFRLGQEVNISYQPDHLHTVRAPGAIDAPANSRRFALGGQLLIGVGIVCLLASLCTLLFQGRQQQNEQSRKSGSPIV